MDAVMVDVRLMRSATETSMTVFCGDGKIHL